MALIRPLVEGDASAFRRLRLEALASNPEAFGQSHAEASREDEAAYAARIRGTVPPSAIFGAFAGGDGGELAGIAGFLVHAREKQRHKGDIWGVYVTPAQRGTGVGRALMQAVIAHARAHVEALRLTVVTENAPARALYRRLGFLPYGLERDALRVDGRSYDEELMTLDLVTPPSG